MVRSILPLTLLVCLFAQPALAEFIAVRTPTTITRPGHYYLANDVSCDTCDQVILIDADRVTLDLNRWTLRGTWAAIRIAPGRTQVTIRNGTAIANWRVIWQSSTGSNARISINEMTLAGSDWRNAVSIEGAGHVEVSSCYIVREGLTDLPPGTDDYDDAGIYVSARSGRIADNTIGPGFRAIHLEGFHGGEVAGNQIFDNGDVGGIGQIFLRGGKGNRVVGNTVSDSTGPAIEVGDGNYVEGNVISDTEEGGILAGDGNLIVGNTITRSGDSDNPFAISVGSRNTVRNNNIQDPRDPLMGNGIRVTGSSNLIDANLVEGYHGEMNAALYFTATSSHNAFCENMLRDNDTKVQDDGSGNRDEGGNIF